MKTHHFYSGFVLMTCLSFSLFTGSQAAAAEPTKWQKAQISKASAEMAAVAKRWLASLSKEQRAQATFKFDDEQRSKWHFVPDFVIKPDGRKGLTIGQMTPQQRIFALALPATALSNRGYLEMMSIRALEKVLYDIEGKDYRDPELYYVSIFGKPNPKGTWGWRFEGHHLSVNVTIIDGKKFSVTPSFFGSNPGKITSGNLAGVEVLEKEQTLALSLIQSFDNDQMAIATIDTSAMDKKLLQKSVIKEVLTTDEPKADRGLFTFKGISFADLDPSQQKKLLSLVNVYTTRFRPEILNGTRYKGRIKDGSDLYFAWSGGKKRGEFHYYRIQSKTFLIEFANTQNNANHVHAVWREFDGDFGRDYLSEHFSKHHKKK